MTPDPTFDEAATALRNRAQLLASTLNNGHSGDHWIAELNWSAGELAAHMVSVPRIYRSVVSEPDSFTIPTSMAAFGQAELEAVGTLELVELSKLLVESVDELIEALAPLADPVTFYTTELPRHGVLGVALNELSMHHRDLALAVGEPFVMSDRDVVITMHGMMPASAVFNDYDVARKCTGTFHIGLRTGDDWTIRVRDGRVKVTAGKPKRADVRITGSAQGMVLTSFGRLHPVKAFLTGQVFVRGVRPWKLWWLQKLFVEELSLNADAQIGAATSFSTDPSGAQPASAAD